MSRQHRTLPVAWASRSLAAALGAVISTGCLQINEDHCIAKEGDAYCRGLDESRSMCSMSPDRTPEPSDNGCVDEVPPELVHVKYGLPRSFEALQRNVEAAGTECELGEIEDLRGVYDTLFETVIRLLDGKSRTDKESIALRGPIEAFNRGVDDWIMMNCEGSTGTSTGADTSSTSDTTATTDSDTETTGPRPPCESNADCMGMDAAFCEPVSRECVPCNEMPDPDGACMEVNPNMPVCDGGACVPCTPDNPATCTGTTPVCNDANACVGCTEHAQCGEAACNFYTGACLTGAVVHVGPGLEFASLTQAVASFGAEPEGTIIVHQDGYTDDVTVNGGRVLAFLANEGDLPIWANATGSSSQLAVTDGTVFLDGLQLSGNINNPAVHISQGKAWIDRSRIVSNEGGAVLAEAGADVVLRNCFVGGDHSGSIMNRKNAVEINAASATIVYSTLAAGMYYATALSCTDPLSVTVRNSLIVALGMPIPNFAHGVRCNGANITYTATEAGFAGTGNVTLGQMPPASPNEWFVNYPTDDLHLTTPPAALATTARWTTVDPATDIDGDFRPTMDGTLDYAGADLP